VSTFPFDVLATDSRSGLRAGVLHTPHGDVATPAFMPVGTLGTVKALTPDDVRRTGARVILSNTYHLLLQPGVETIRQLGGLHQFCHWDGTMLTDSGGFQVFSLGRLRKISDEGVTFESHIDGAEMALTPECVVEAEEALGADLIMPLDECLGPKASRAQAADALERTQRWFERSLAARRRADQAMFALLQGGLFADLRREGARAGVATRPPGFAIGGLSIGEPRSLTRELLEATLPELPTDRPRYLMGVGHPRDVFEYARLGVDLFDCVLPTRLARNGTVWRDADGTRLDLGRRTLLGCSDPIDATCPCAACTHWSVGMLATLFQAREPLVYRLASVHNLTLLARIAGELRNSVLYTATQTPMARRVLNT
jgi:queuine tRNA-ribosyltransferase